MTDAKIWQRLAQHWHENDCDASAGVSAEAIGKFEHKYQVVLPADLRAYFLAMNGQHAMMGDDYFRFWPLAEVKPVSEELSDIHAKQFLFPHCFKFADYLINSCAYAVEMGSNSDAPGAVYCINGTENPQVAASFVEFIQAYVENPSSMVF